jgi:hypothetical protein
MTRLIGVFPVDSAMSLSANSESTPIKLSLNIGFSVQITWTGSSPVGQAKLQASINGVDYVDVDDSTDSISGNTGTTIWTVRNSSYRWVKVVYTRTSGTGSAVVVHCTN